MTLNSDAEQPRWGRSWMRLLETSGEAYQARLPAGRSLARKGAVRELDLAPGHVSARVVGAHGEIHRVDIAVRTLAPSEWGQVAELIASHASNLAALLDGVLRPSLLDDLNRVDIQLLPRPSDLRPDCSCEDWAEPCSHAAALCYAVGEVVDRDPFSLFLLRGMPRNDLIELVRSARSGERPGYNSDDGIDAPVGVPAEDIWRGRRMGDPLGPTPPLSETEVALRSHGPGRRSRWQVDIPPRFGVVPSRIDDLADDAVMRAWRMIEYGDDSMVRLDARSDLARRASAADWPSAVADLASLGGVTSQHLSAWTNAWRIAGSEGVEVVSNRNCWVKDPDLLAEGREQLVSLGLDRRSIALNYDSIGLSPGVILILAPSGRWYRLHGSGSHQDVTLAREPSTDVTELA